MASAAPFSGAIRPSDARDRQLGRRRRLRSADRDEPQARRLLTDESVEPAHASVDRPVDDVQHRHAEA
jgi:hypothetical protein